MSTHAFQISRRSFLSSCTALATTSCLPLWFVHRELEAAAIPNAPTSPLDRPGIALVGCGGMGRGDATNARRFGDILAVCDVDAGQLDAATKQFTIDGKTPTPYHDFRKLLEHPGIDVIIQATPDHWHTLINLAAIHAGKHVYAEKPLTLTINEGRRLVTAVRKAKAILQTGSQQRSDRNFRLACELIRNGRLGRLRQITVFLPAGLRGGPFGSTPVPRGLDWDFYLGQAPDTAYVKERCHTTFRYWFDYSGGTMTDWGAHHNDIARWAIGLDGPTGIQAEVLAVPVPGGYTAFSEYRVTYSWPGDIQHVVHTTTGDSIYGSIVNPQGQRHGIKFEGDEGWIWVTRGDLTASRDEIINTPLPDSAVRLESSSDHMKNFFDCVRSRHDPIAHVEVGHRSASLCHIGVIALRLGRKLSWDALNEQFVGDAASEANAFLTRDMRKPYDYGFIG